MTVTIRDLRVICTRPAGFNLVIVRIDTSQPGLYGLGCGTFTFRYEAVANVIEEFLKPLLIGRDVSRIEDIWQMMHVSSYWRTGPITNNAIAGIDLALWDIKGKMAQMPVYNLLGGKVREAVPVYRYAESGDLEELTRQVKVLMDDGAKYIRIQGAYTPDQVKALAPEGSLDGYYIDPKDYCHRTAEMFRHIRKEVGYEVELVHDVHERISPSQALWLARELEPYDLFFLEDILSPEQGGWFKNIRSQTSTPLAQGELFTNPREWEDLVTERRIDFMRAHITQIGGITPARKLAAFCEQFEVRMAWHGSPDMSPLGHTVNLHMDMAIHNFGVQEWPGMPEVMRQMFPGCPWMKGSYAYVNDRPGWGLEFDEKIAAQYPCSKEKTPWIEMRMPDGSLGRP